MLLREVRDGESESVLWREKIEGGYGRRQEKKGVGREQTVERTLLTKTQLGPSHEHLDSRSIFRKMDGQWSCVSDDSSTPHVRPGHRPDNGVRSGNIMSLKLNTPQMTGVILVV